LLSWEECPLPTRGVVGRSATPLGLRIDFAFVYLGLRSLLPRPALAALTTTWAIEFRPCGGCERAICGRRGGGVRERARRAAIGGAVGQASGGTQRAADAAIRTLPDRNKKRHPAQNTWLRCTRGLCWQLTKTLFNSLVVRLGAPAGPPSKSGNYEKSRQEDTRQEKTSQTTAG
jgi:hypothetical protein